MLPLWRNRVYIAISPEHLTMVKLGRGLKPKLLAQFDEAIQPQPGDQPLWQASLDRLSQLLAQEEWQHAEAEIVLSNKLARYALISPSVKLKKYAAQEAFARHALSQTYGVIAKQWTLRIQQGKATEPWLVSAIDQTLLGQLQLICKSNKLKLNNVIPRLVPVFNCLSKQIKADPAWLVIYELGMSLCVLVQGGLIVRISNVSHESINELPFLLDQENLVSSLPVPCKTVYLHTRLAVDLPTIRKSGYEINKLEAVDRESLLAYAHGLTAMALIGVM